MAMMNYVTVLLLTSSLTFWDVVGADGPTTRDCSFSSGQCDYSVHLKHAEHGDDSTISDASGVSRADRQDTDALLLRALQAEAERDTLKVDLLRKDMELKSVKDDLNRVISQSDAVIKNLTDQLSTCQMTGPSTVTTETPSVVHGHIDDKTYVSYCDFSNVSTCGYTLVPDKVHFSLMQHRRSKRSGPWTDHTYGTRGLGQYIGLDTVEMATDHLISNSNTVKSAYAESPVLDPAPNYCVLFYYSMRGYYVVGLDVNVKVATGMGSPVWSKIGEQPEADWLLGQFDLANEYTRQPFQVVFVAKSDAYSQYSYAMHGSSWSPTNMDGEIGVDDVYIYNRSCAEVSRCPSSSFKRTVGNTTSCYTFHSTPATWEEAYEECRLEGPWSALVSIETSGEQAFLVNLIQQNTGLYQMRQNGCFTSGNDKEKEGVYVWTNTGEARGVNYTEWDTMQPNNFGNNQDCIAVTAQSKWDDVECDVPRPFVCESSQ